MEGTNRKALCMATPAMANDEPTGHAASRFFREGGSLGELIADLDACNRLGLRDVTVTSVVYADDQGPRVRYHLEAVPADFETARRTSSDRIVEAA